MDLINNYIMITIIQNIDIKRKYKIIYQVVPLWNSLKSLWYSVVKYIQNTNN